MELDKLVAIIEEAAPGFAAYTGSEENPFDVDNPHGIFAACSHFVREYPPSARSWESLAAFANSVIGNGDSLDNAACTCFLENLADENHPLEQHLQGSALEFWREWTSI